MKIYSKNQNKLYTNYYRNISIEIYLLSYK